MKNTDKVTLTIGQLKKLIKESKRRITESTPEQIEVRKMAEQAKANGEYYAIGYMDSSNLYPDFICSSSDRNEILEMAKDMMVDEDGTLFYETVNVCDPNGRIIKTFEPDDGESDYSLFGW